MSLSENRKDGLLKMKKCTFRIAKQEELEKCTEFANMVFDLDFHELLPKVYGGNPIMQATHYIADDGEPKGLVAVLGDRLTVGETVLKTGYVGTVSVHPDARGQGIMGKLMEMANNDMLTDGTDIAFLNGNRQRYQYYGFVPAGEAYYFNINESNVTHALSDVSTDGIRFEEIGSESEFEQKARALYRSRPVHFERAEFAVLCRSNHGTPYAVLGEDKFIGYVVANNDKTSWAEVCVENNEGLDMAVNAWMVQNQIQNLRISLPEWEGELRRHLACYASGMSRGYSVQARIFKFRRVAEAYLKIKARTGGISDGHMAFDIEGQRFEITVKNGNVTAREGGENPLKLTAYEANKLMLLPIEYEDMPKAPRGWFPLGVFIAPGSPDGF